MIRSSRPSGVRDSIQWNRFPVSTVSSIPCDSPMGGNTHRPRAESFPTGAVIQIEQRVRDLTGWLLARENVIRGSTGETGPTEFSVCGRLRAPLCLLSGQAGFRALLSRALNLAKAECPRLATLQVDASAGLKGLDLVEPNFTPKEAREAELVLVAYFLQLLWTFVGEALTLRLVQGVWPDAVFDRKETGKEDTP